MDSCLLQTKNNSEKIVQDMDISHIASIIEAQRKYFQTRETYDLKFRIKTLKKLRTVLKLNSGKIVEAIQMDMRRPFYEAYGADYTIPMLELSHTIRKLKKWAKPEKINPGLIHFYSKVEVRSIPKGVVLVVSAWNYPIHLCLIPLIGALAAGNTVVIKPSEIAINSSNFLVSFIQEVFPPEYVTVCAGGPNVAQELLNHKFDHIIFTGSPRVGKIFLEKAAQQFTPITLELGGKSPVIIHESAKLRIAVQRIIFAKFTNAGQTCVAPDYVLIHDSLKDDFIKLAKQTITDYYDDVRSSKDYGRIININHFEHVQSLLNDIDKSKIIFGGETDIEDLFIEPTIIENPMSENLMMQKEIFGPILPVITYNDKNEIYNWIEKNPNPLVLYVYSEDKEFVKYIIESIPSGDLSINDSNLHFAVPGTKIGGLGESGIGYYRGKFGFGTFSHKKTVYKKSTIIKLPFIKPPFTKLKIILLKLFSR
jgi:aldehyde dehydrogenase (NAD+)